MATAKLALYWTNASEMAQWPEYYKEPRFSCHERHESFDKSYCFIREVEVTYPSEALSREAAIRSALSALAGEEREARRELAKRLAAIEEQRSRLLSIEGPKE